MIIDNQELFKVWVAQTLAPICDGDPKAVAKYVLALVKKDKPVDELKNICNDQLGVFLQDRTEDFVTNLFQGLADGTYGYMSNANSSSGETSTSQTSEAQAMAFIELSPEEAAANLERLREQIKAHDVAGVRQCLKDGVGYQGTGVRKRGDHAILALAVKENQLDIVKLLLATDRYILLPAVEQCADIHDEEQEIAKFLLSTATDSDMWPPGLHKAAEKDNIPLMKVLIEHKADVNESNYVDMVPLGCACKHGNVKAAEFLIEHGAACQYNRKCSSFFTSPFTAAIEAGQTDLVRLLVRHGANPNEIEDMAGYSRLLNLCFHQQSNMNLKMLQTLIEVGADVNGKTYAGFNCLHLLAQYKPNTSVLKCLIEAGADVYHKCHVGHTPLWRACRFANAEFMAALLDLGVDVRRGDTKERGRYINATLEKLKRGPKIYPCHKIVSTVELLVAAGAYLPPIATLQQTENYLAEANLDEQHKAEAKNILAWVKAETLKPPMLTDICSQQIRGAIARSGRVLSETVEELEVPEIVRAFLTFANLAAMVEKRLKQFSGTCKYCRKQYTGECNCWDRNIYNLSDSEDEYDERSDGNDENIHVFAHHVEISDDEWDEVASNASDEDGDEHHHDHAYNLEFP